MTFKYEEVEMEVHRTYNNIVIIINEDGIIEGNEFEVSH